MPGYFRPRGLQFVYINYHDEQGIFNQVLVRDSIWFMYPGEATFIPLGGEEPITINLSSIIKIGVKMPESED